MQLNLAHNVTYHVHITNRIYLLPQVCFKTNMLSNAMFFMMLLGDLLEPSDSWTHCATHHFVV